MTATYSRPDGKNRFQIRSAALGSLPSAWLDQEFNSIYGVLNGLTVSSTVSANEWKTETGTYTYISSTSFSVAGDMTGAFEPLRAIRFNENTVSHIQSSSYDAGTGITTVVVYPVEDAIVVPSTISKVEVGFQSKESSFLASVQTKGITNNYTISAIDQIILVDDSAASTTSYDDGQIITPSNPAYIALWVTLPVASSLPNKLICIKKKYGNNQTIISSAYTFAEATDADNHRIASYTYDFQIKGDTYDKNRVTLKGVGDCAWFVSDGNNWYELTPEASETVKGIARFATSDEMTLTSQQIADGEELSKTLAISPYQVDKTYLRTDASNMQFASNYIYTSPNGVAALIDGSIIVYKGLGLAAPDGKESSGICKTKRYELTSNLQETPIEVSTKKKFMFVEHDSSDNSFSLTPILASNYYMGYTQPTPNNTVLNDKIIWFDYQSNLLKLSTDNGTNWTTFDGAGPVCEFFGDGSVVSSLVPYSAVGFLTRDDLNKIPYIVESYRSENSYYYVWSNGLCVQGGISLSSSGQVSPTFTFLKPLTGIASILATVEQATPTSYVPSVQVLGATNTSVQFSTRNDGLGVALSFYWEVKGYVY